MNQPANVKGQAIAATSAAVAVALIGDAIRVAADMEVMLFNPGPLVVNVLAGDATSVADATCWPLDVGVQRICPKGSATHLSMYCASGTQQVVCVGAGVATAAPGATAPTFTRLPQILGIPTIGVPVSFLPGAVDGTPTITRTQQWYVDGVPVATTATYTPVAAAALTVMDIATNSAGAHSAISPGVLVQAASSGGGGGGGGAVVPDVFVASYATYATGLAAVAEGQSFATPIDTYRDGVWLRTSGVGVMTGCQPHDQTTGLVRPAVTAAGALPTSPIVDLDSVDCLWGVNEVLNRASGAAAPTMNLLWKWNGSRTYFLNGSITDATMQADSQGGTSAVRLTYAAGAVAVTDAVFITTVPAGQWTFQFDAYVANGVSPQAWMLATNSTTGLQAITVTSTKQTFSGTFTSTASGSRNLGLYQGSYPAAAAAAGDIFIENVRLVPGPAAQVGVQDQNNRVGYWLSTLASSFSGTALTAAAGSTFAMKAAAAFGSDTYTLAFCANLSRPSATSALLYAANATMGRTTYLGQSQNTDASAQVCDSMTYNNGSSADATFKVSGYGWQVHVLRVTPTGLDYWVDGQQIKGDAGASTIASAVYLALLGGVTNAIATQWPASGAVSGIAMWNSKLSGADIVTVTGKMLARLIAKGLAKTPIKAIHLAEGDSITAGTGDTVTAGMGGYAARAHDLLAAPRPIYRNEGVFGATLMGAPGTNSLMGRQAADLAIMANYKANGWTTVLTVLIGTNDAPATQAAAETYFTNLVAYVATMRAAGAKVIVCTQIPYGSNAAYSDTTQTVVGGTFAGNTYTGWRGYIRAMILAGSANFDGVADYGGETTFSQTYAIANAAGYFTDVAHPTPLADSIMAAILALVLQSVVNAIA